MFRIKREIIDNGAAYYEYMLVYAGYVLHLAKDAYKYMLKLNQFYRLKEDLGTLDRYLGANFDTFQL